MAKTTQNPKKVDVPRSEKVQKVVEKKTPTVKQVGPAKAFGVVKRNSVKATQGDLAPGAKKKSSHPSTSKMVTEALSSLKNRKGHTLAAIRKFIAENFDCKLTKKINNLIKKFIGEEFVAGRIRMVNYDSKEINYQQRFALVK